MNLNEELNGLFKEWSDISGIPYNVPMNGIRQMVIMVVCMAPGDLSLRVKDFFHFLTKHYAICDKNGINPVYKDRKKEGILLSYIVYKPNSCTML